MISWLITRADIAPLFHNRFMLFAYLPLIFSSALVVLFLPNRLMKVVFIASAVCLHQATEGPIRKIVSGSNYPRLAREDWKQAVAHLNANDVQPGWPVFLRSGLIETDRLLALSHDRPTHEYLTFPLRALYTLRNFDRPIETLRFDGSFVEESQLELIRDSGGAWFIVKGSRELANRAFQEATSRLRGRGLVPVQEERLDLINLSVFRVRCGRIPEDQR
jgi:hypothetical protein